MIRYGWFYWFRLEEMCVRNIGYFVDYRFPRCFWVANLTYISEKFVSGFSSLGLGALKHVSRLVTEPVKPGFRMSFHSEDPVIEYTSVGFVFFDTHCSPKKWQSPFLKEKSKMFFFFGIFSCPLFKCRWRHICRAYTYTDWLRRFVDV